MNSNPQSPAIDPATRLWTPNQLQVMRGLGIPAWVGAGLSVIEEAVSSNSDHKLGANVSPNPSETIVKSTPDLPAENLALGAGSEPQMHSTPELAPPTPPHSSALSEARALDASSWQSLADTAARCNACSLCAQGQRLPFGFGAEQAGGVLVVLDAAHCDGQETLTHAAHALLSAMLRSVGLDLAAQDSGVYVTTTVKGGAPARWAALDPLGAEISACAPHLERQIVLKQAPLIIAMGQGAAQAMMALDEPLAALRGELHDFECEGYSGQLLVTHHPQTLLTAPQLKREAWQDLCLAIDAGLLQSSVKLPRPAARSK